MDMLALPIMLLLFLIYEELKRIHAVLIDMRKDAPPE
jgi:hypothetical protein